jgi:ABC-type amino acid transport substrate-binding protein
MGVAEWAGIAGAVAAAIAVIPVIRSEHDRRRGQELSSTDTTQTAPPTEATPAVYSRRDRVLSERVLRCGCVKHPPLADYTRDGGDWVFSGLFVDLARKVESDNLIRVQLTPIDWTDLERAFEDFELDVVLSVFETKKRHEIGDFVCPFYKIGLSGVARAGARKVINPLDLQRDDVKIVVTKGEAGWECATVDLGIPRHRLIVIEAADLATMMDCVASGRADVGICDDVSCMYFIASNPHLSLTRVLDTPPLALCSNSIMVPKGDPSFAAWVDELFSRAREGPLMEAAEDRALAAGNGLIRRFR